MKKRKGQYDNCAYLMILPAYTIFAIFVIVPIIVVIACSFTNYDMFNPPEFVGFANYKRMLADAAFKTSVTNTMKYSIFTLIPQLFLAVVIANLLFRKSKWVTAFRTAFYLPYVISMVCVSMIWMWMFDPNSGIFNQLLSSAGLPVQTWLSDPKLALPCIIVTGIWKNLGYSVVIYLSGLTAIPSDLYEAAMVDGAGNIRRFRYISLPLLKSSTIFLVITGMISCFSVFEQVNIMTNGGPLNSTTTIVHQIYQRGFQSNQMGYACSMGVVLFIIVCVFTFLVFYFGRQERGKEKINE